MKSLAAYPEHGLSGEEKAGLVVALAAHAALVAWLMLNPPAPRPMPVPERMTVTLSDEVAERSTSPEPKAEAAPAVAPVLAPEPAPAPVPSPIARPEPQPQPAPKVAAAPVPQPVPRPAAKAQSQPAPKPMAKSAPPKPAAGGGSKFGDAFTGVFGGTKIGAKSPAPSAQAVGQLRTSFAQSILRKVRPEWQGRAPQGVNTDKIISYIAVTLNPDGTLAGSPRLMKQDGVDDTNRAQAGRHAEEAIRAIRLAAPFDLPADQYELWKNLPPLAFRKSANQ